MPFTMKAAFGIVILAACGAADPTPRHPLSAAEHYDEARAHEQAAKAHDRAALAEQRSARSTVICGDHVLADQSTSGGVPVAYVVPCWKHLSARDAHLRRASRLRTEARAHRVIATSLIEAQRAACATIPPEERDHSPSWHRDDVLAVEPVVKAGAVHGARIVFRKVEALTADWLRSAFACHQAGAAVEGYDPTFMSYCPAGLEGVTFDVTERTDGFVVTFQSPRTEIGAAIWGRARDALPGEAPAATRRPQATR